MNKQGLYWDTISQNWPRKPYRNQIFAEHKRRTYLKLLEGWVNPTNSQIILKTDLFDEAFYEEQYLFDTSWADSTIGMDISREVVESAKSMAKLKHINNDTYLCCDVMALPFKNSSVDYIISDSTIDHFTSESQIITALEEMSRILKVGGVMVLVLDNKNNITYPPYFIIQMWMKLGLAPYFIGRTLSLKQLQNIFNRLYLNIEDRTAIFHYPHPDILIRGLESVIHRICGDRLNNFMRSLLILLESLEKRRISYITGRYIAVKAIKQENSK